MTIGQYIDTHKIPQSTFRSRWKSAGLNGSLEKSREITPGELTQLHAKNRAKKTREVAQKSRTKNEIAPHEVAHEISASEPEIVREVVREKRNPWTIAALVFCAVAVVSHGAMLCSEAERLFGVPGLFGAVAIFCANFFALLISVDKEKSGTSDQAVWAALLLDCLAARIHYVYFCQGSGETWDKFFFACAVPGATWLLVYFFRSILND